MCIVGGQVTLEVIKDLFGSGTFGPVHGLYYYRSVGRNGMDTLALACVIDVRCAIAGLGNRMVPVLRIVVMEDEAAAALLNLSAWCALKVVVENASNRLFPCPHVVRIGHFAPSIASTILKEAAVLSNQAQIGNAAEETIQFFGPSARHNVDSVGIVHEQIVQDVQGALCRSIVSHWVKS